MQLISKKLKIKQKLRPFFSRKRLFFFGKRCFSSFRFLKQQLFFYVKKMTFCSMFFYHHSLYSFLFTGLGSFFFFRFKVLDKFNFYSFSFSDSIVNKHFFASSFFCKKLFI